MITTERPVLTLAELEAFDLHPSGSGRERRFRCPLPACRDKPKQNLSLNTESGLWDCYRCGAGGKLRERWEDRPVQAIRRERARARFRLPPDRQPGTAESAALLPGLLGRCRPLAGSTGQRYLFDRGIGLGVATPAGVLFTGDCYGRPAVVFPLRDQAGQLVALHARHTDGRTDPKCHTVGDRSLGAFATPGALAAGAPLVVVEGPVDALSLATCDVPAVALVATTAPRWLRVVAGFRRVVVALDADDAGDRASEELQAELAPFARSVERLRPPWGKDWNDTLLANYPGLCEFLAAAGLPSA